jgi:hypothetical protein
MSVITARARHAIVIALLFGALSVATPASAGSLTLTFGDSTVTVSGATPGGDVVLFATAKEGNNSVLPVPTKTGEAVVLHDGGHDGRVTLERKRPVPLIAVWIAVDLTTGQWTASGSPGFDAHPIPPADFTKRDAGGQLRKLSVLVPEMDAILVRPGTGAWRIYAAKTSAVDENGRGALPLQVDVSAMTSLSPSLPKLDLILPGDVIVLIEPQSMDFAVEVAQ